jgi:hypothetical protein
VTFGITVNTYVRMCGIIIPRHTCDEYPVLVSKSGMTNSPTSNGLILMKTEVTKGEQSARLVHV